jgi:hypothetical protein
MIINTLNRTTITDSIEVVKNINPTFSTFTASPKDNFMLGIEVWMLNITAPQRYFDIALI